jgi:hypothetical protein
MAHAPGIGTRRCNHNLYFSRDGFSSFLRRPQCPGLASVVQDGDDANQTVLLRVVIDTTAKDAEGLRERFFLVGLPRALKI